jgi:cytochrome c oxidase assembly protein subunit 15
LASLDASQTAQIITSARRDDRLRPVRIWLYTIAALVLLMVALGGETRLTGSGLSITEWKPISGTIPPLSDAAWQAEFDNYKKIPQYQVNNPNMTVDGFKSIYWWEWTHRLLGRFIGLAFAVPFLVFLFQRRFTWSLATPLAGLFVLGGFQGVLGWWMVSSGLSKLTSVSQYRLAAHLSAALVLFLALIWVARRLAPQKTGAMTRLSLPRAPVTILLLLVFLQIVAGAFVAGLHAGMGYNTWPLMDGALIPNGLGVMDPAWRNLFENTMTVQFIHRCIAYVVVLVAFFLLWRQTRVGGFSGPNRWMPRIVGMICLQVVLGISTLLLMVPSDLAVAHQLVAFILAGSIMAYLADMTSAIAITKR